MSEQQEKKATRRVRKVRHNGRGSQVLIYLGKQFRFFVNQSDWKVLLMAGVIAALVAMVIRRRYFINMEGSLIGGFALACVALWNGCFNSIQSVCRERAIIKREHRSGMHISSYVAAHMIYQLMLCLLQTGVTMYVLQIVGVQFPDKGVITPWMIVDVGISMLLISYAADMMSLFLSSVSRTTTSAMTLMPFVLIFQLVFSGGIIPLPAWSQGLSNFTISNYGIKALTSQGGYNELPMVAVWNAVSGMRDSEIGGTYTVEELIGYLDHPVVEQHRDVELIRSYTIGEAARAVSTVGEALKLREKEIITPVSGREVIRMVLDSSALSPLRDLVLKGGGESGEKTTIGSLLRDLLGNEDQEVQEDLDKKFGPTVTLGEILDAMHADQIVEALADTQLNEPITVGKLVDFIRNDEKIQEQKDQTVTLKFTMGQVFDLFGEENIRNLIETKTAEASRKDIYEKTPGNIADNWLMLGLFVLVFAALSVIVLEMIDKDKR